MTTALATDFYEIAMAAAYSQASSPRNASFELTVRTLPSDRGYLVAAGLDSVLDYLERLSFSLGEIDYLRNLPRMRNVPATFFDRVLPGFRFTGSVWAVQEGELVFPHEPLLRITAPMAEAQIVETALLSFVLFQTAVTSRSARIVCAAKDKPVFEFGARRAHGLEAGVLAARAAYIGGCAGTSMVEAGRRFGLPLSGTMAHSWVMSHTTEREAFVRYMDLYGNEAVLLIDTYDTVAAVRKIEEAGLRPTAVRIDSGDLGAECRAVRSRLDAAGLSETRILVSGDLDEYRIHELVEMGAPIDAFGVGTAISTAPDVMEFGGAYKLVEIENHGRPVAVVKLSRGKSTYPGLKQVWRVRQAGAEACDVIGTVKETAPAGGRPLLKRVMHEGRRCRLLPSLQLTQETTRNAISELPTGVRRLRNPTAYRVVMSETLTKLRNDISQQRRSAES